MMKEPLPTTNDAWCAFCRADDNHTEPYFVREGFAYLRPPAVLTYEADYQACKKDAESGVPQAAELMTKFVKFRMQS